MVTEAASGTQNAVIDTEHTLSTQTTAGVYQLVVDASNLANGDVVTLRLKLKTLSGSTSALAFDQTLAHAQGSPIFISPPVAVAHEIVATLEQTAGTGRSFDWSLMRAT